MALVKGNQSSYNSTPSANNFSWSHNHDVGADGHMVVVLASPAAATITGVTYNGVSMTLIQRQSAISPSTMDWTMWELDSPSTGTNTIAVTLSGSQFNACSAYVYSFTGCSGIGDFDANLTPVAEQNTFTLSISENSMIIGTAYASSNTGAYVDIPQLTSTTVDWDHNVNNRVWGGISLSLPAGSVTAELGLTVTNSVTVMGVEVREAGTVTVTRRIFLVT